jgi:hypothetical protein
VGNLTLVTAAELAGGGIAGGALASLAVPMAVAKIDALAGKSWAAPVASVTLGAGTIAATTFATKNKHVRAVGYGAGLGMIIVAGASALVQMYNEYKANQRPATGSVASSLAPGAGVRSLPQPPSGINAVQRTGVSGLAALSGGYRYN